MDISIFIDKNITPDDNVLIEKLGDTYELWRLIWEYANKSYPKAFEEWKYSGKNYGWSFRIKDEKRVIIYLLPRDKFFKVAFVFGQKATDEIIKSYISSEIKNELLSAKVYAEGRGIRLDVIDFDGLNDIKRLIDIKLAKH